MRNKIQETPKHPEKKVVPKIAQEIARVGSVTRIDIRKVVGKPHFFDVIYGEEDKGLHVSISRGHTKDGKHVYLFRSSKKLVDIGVEPIEILAMSSEKDALQRAKKIVATPFKKIALERVRKISVPHTSKARYFDTVYGKVDSSVSVIISRSPRDDDFVYTLRPNSKLAAAYTQKTTANSEKEAFQTAKKMLRGW